MNRRSPFGAARTAVALVVVLAGCARTTAQPEVTPGQYAPIEAAVAAIYPGVPEGKATDWAQSTCSDLGKDEATLVDNVRQRFAGGDRPDPTPEQAAQILAVIRASGFCV